MTQVPKCARVFELESMQLLQGAVVMGIFFLATSSHSLSMETCQRVSMQGKMQSLQVLKQDFLLRLGLDEEPTNPSNASDIPIELLKEFEDVQIVQELNHESKPCRIQVFNVQEVKLFSPKEVKKFKPNLRGAVGGVNCIRNNLSEFYSTYRITFQVDLNDTEFISSVQLRLTKFHLQVTNNLQETVVRAPGDIIDVRLITRPENYYNKSKYVHITMEHLANDDDSKLAVFNMTKGVILWLASSSQSKMGELELDIQHRCPQSLSPNNIFIPNFQFFENSDNDGQLILTTYKKKNGNENNRNKRQEINHDFVFHNETHIECHMKKFTINFEQDFNWTWVSRPKEIEFKYCKGECPIKWGLSDTHAEFRDIIRSRSQHNPTSAPEPCCVPNSFSDLSLLINIRGIYSMQSLNDFVATSCSCR